VFPGRHMRLNDASHGTFVCYGDGVIAQAGSLVNQFFRV